MKTITRKIIVAAVNSNGESDFHFFKVTALEKHFENEKLHKAAKEFSTKEGYEPCLVYDEYDNAGLAILDKFEWETATTIYLDKDGEIIELGETVIVPDPDETDIHNHMFEGTISKIRESGIIAVRDGENDHFDIEHYRLTKSESS